MSTIEITSPDEEAIKRSLEKRTDPEGARIRRYLAMPDLSRTPGSPVKEVVDRASAVPSLKGFDNIKIPEIVPTEILFDLFNMPPGHPARSPSDTYYVDEGHVLRTHDTVFWYYYLNQPEIKKRIAAKDTLGAICYGKVYRKDEIDRSHMNVFHQFGGWLIAPDGVRTITPDDLKHTLSEVATSIFGNINFRFYDHQFPYTDPSFEMEAELGGKWVEMVGSGMVRKSVLKNLGLEGYNGWAFGFGLERLAMASMELPDIRLLWSADSRVKAQLKLNQKFKEVSKYPPIVRDISFIVAANFVPNDYFDFVREIAPGLVEQVELLDKYENVEKFGVGKLSYAYRITYRSLERTLTGEEIDILHKKLESETKKNFGGKIR
ncbi:MAG: hypothetical protein AAB500_01730 [Patescibacteria group bacterium]